MLKTRSIHPMSAVLGGLAAVLVFSAAAVHAAPLPPIQTQGDIRFVTGGVDVDTARAFEAARPQWPVTLEFAVKDKPVNAYLADVQVQLRDAAGREVLNSVSDGPFMLVSLAPGRYHVTARFGGKALEAALQVKAGEPVKEVFMWPQASLRAGG